MLFQPCNNSGKSIEAIKEGAAQDAFSSAPRVAEKTVGLLAKSPLAFGYAMAIDTLLKSSVDREEN